MTTTKGFKDILEVRQENMKLQQNRRARYGKTASSALGKPLAFAPPPPPRLTPSGEVNVTHTLPRPDGIQSGANGSSSSELVPLISTLSQEQVVAEQQNYTDARAEAVSQIESHIVDIGQMFGRLTTILHEQEDLVRRCVRVAGVWEWERRTYGVLYCGVCTVLLAGLTTMWTTRSRT